MKRYSTCLTNITLFDHSTCRDSTCPVIFYDLPDAESDLNEIEKLKLEIKKLIDAEIEKMKLEREKLIRQVCKNLFYFFMVYVFVRIGLHYAEVWYLSKYRGF